VEDETFASDTNDFSLLNATLHRLVERAGRGLRGRGQVAGQLSVRLRHSDFREAKGVVRLPRETDLDQELFEASRPLLERLLGRRVRVRWLALSLAKLASAPAQIPLFPSGPTSKAASLLSALDCIRAKYGESAVHRGAPTTAGPGV
jgi:DNA polymerase-4